MKSNSERAAEWRAQEQEWERLKASAETLPLTSNARGPLVEACIGGIRYCGNLASFYERQARIKAKGWL